MLAVAAAVLVALVALAFHLILRLEGRVELVLHHL
jgi:hypothetical protein